MPGAQSRVFRECGDGWICGVVDGFDGGGVEGRSRLRRLGRGFPLLLRCRTDVDGAYAAAWRFCGSVEDDHIRRHCRRNHLRGRRLWQIVSSAFSCSSCYRRRGRHRRHFYFSWRDSRRSKRLEFVVDV